MFNSYCSLNIFDKKRFIHYIFRVYFVETFYFCIPNIFYLSLMKDCSFYPDFKYLIYKENVIFDKNNIYISVSFDLRHY